VNFVSLGSVLFSLLGCASVSVESQRADTTRRLRRKPQVLIVKDFSFPRQAEVRADRSGKELLTFEQKVQLSLREQLVRALGRYGHFCKYIAGASKTSEAATCLANHRTVYWGPTG